MKLARVFQTRRVGEANGLAFRGSGLSVETKESPMPGRDRYIDQLGTPTRETR